MTHNQRRNATARRAVIAVHIAPADAARFHFDENFTRTRPRHRYIHHLQPAVFR
jgi:hypothetical protein